MEWIQKKRGNLNKSREQEMKELTFCYDKIIIKSEERGENANISKCKRMPSTGNLHIFRVHPYGLAAK